MKFKTDWDLFAVLLEEAGYEYPLTLIEYAAKKAFKERTSLPIAINKHAEFLAKSGKPELSIALKQMDVSRLNKLELNEIITEMPA